jgi:hypothetical protein
MQCATIVAALKGLQPGAADAPPHEKYLEPLEALGLVRRVADAAVDGTEAPRLRQRLSENHLAQAQARSAMVAQAVPSRASLNALQRLQAEEGGLRQRLLDLAAAQLPAQDSVLAGGARYALTYRGRELLATLAPRLHRVGPMELAEFERELAATVSAFDGQARRAQGILQKLSPRLRDVDEIHLRSAAVGLAVHEAHPDRVTDAYVSLLAAQTALSVQTSLTLSEWRCLIAESLCLATKDLGALSPNAAAQEFTALWLGIEGEQTLEARDALIAALILYTYPAAERAPILAEAQDFRVRAGAYSDHPLPLAPAVLVAREPWPAEERLDRFGAYYRALLALGTKEETAMAAAIFTVTGHNGHEALLHRFTASRDFLARFAETGMTFPAAMLAVLSPEVGESLENLRLASSQVTRHRLSLGGIENLSLGMKLMTGVALSPPTPLVPVSGAPVEVGRRTALGLLGLVIPATAAVTAFTALHNATLHRAATNDYGWYRGPMYGRGWYGHSHFYYG